MGGRTESRGMWRRAACAGAAALAIVTAAGCTASTMSGASMPAGGAPEAYPTHGYATADATSAPEPEAVEAPSDVDAGEGAGRSPGSGDGAPGAPVGPVLEERQVIRTATMSVEVRLEPTVIDAETGETDTKADAALRAEAADALAQRVIAAGDAVGGYRSEVNGSGSTVSVTLRVPVESYDTVMRALRGIDGAEVTDLTETTQDVTAQMVDLDSRIGTLQDSVARMRELLAEAAEVGDILAIENELTSRIAELESLQQQRAKVASLAALSTISVTVTAVTEPVEVEAEPVAEPVERDGFVGGIIRGWTAVTAFATWLAGVAGTALPFLPILVVVVVLGWWIRRRVAAARRSPAVAVTGPGAETVASTQE